MAEELPVEPQKHLLLSKTLWINILAVAALIAGRYAPTWGTFIQDNFSEVGGAWAMINVFLRMISKDKLFLS